MKTVDQIVEILSPPIQENNGAVGYTNRRLAKIGDGQGNARPAPSLRQTPRDVFYRSDLDQNDRGVAILATGSSIPLQAIAGHYNDEVWVGNMPGSSSVMILDWADSGGYGTDGPTPMEQLANAGAKPALDNLLILRIAPPTDASMSIYIDTGQIAAVGYETDTGTLDFASSGNLDISDPTNGVIWVPTASALGAGEHRLLGIALDPATGQFIVIPGDTVSTTNVLPSQDSRSEFTEEYCSTTIDFTGYYSLGYVYNYYAQTTPTEDDCMRQFDPRIIFNKLGSGGGGGVTAVTATPPLSSSGGTTPDISHDASGVTPGAYTKASVTVDATGHVTAASSGAAEAPATATYITQTPDAGLSAEQALSLNTTGLMKSTTGTGVVSTATPGTDYTSPAGTENLSNKTITASSLIATALSLLIGGFKGIFTHANTVDRTYTLPDKNGTVAMISDIPAAGITQLTGDVTAGPGSGSQAATLATVNSNVGTFSRVKSVTANAKGLITAITQGLVDLATEITGILSLANGGTHADLSATGGANQFVKQSSVGANLSVGTIASADINTALLTPGPIGTTTPNTGYFSALRELIGGFYAIFTHANTGDRTYTLPDVSGTVALIAATQVLTNKTIDGDDNTVQDLPLTAIKTVGANTKRFLTRDVSGVLVDTANPPLDNLQHDHSNAANGGQLGISAFSRTLLYPANPIINGAFQLWSRIAANLGTVVSYANDAYVSADLWYLLTNSGGSTDVNIERSGVATPYSAQYACRITAAANTPKAGIAQIAEHSVAKSYRGRSIIAQCKFQMTTPAAVRIAVLEWTGTADAVTSDVVNNWASGTYTLGNFFKSTNFALVGTANVTPGAANTATTLSVTGTVSSSCNNLIFFVFSEGAIANGDNLIITECGIFDGTDAIAWFSPSIAVESIRAQRFLKVLFAPSGVTQKLIHGHSISTTHSYFIWQPPVAFRVLPTLTATAADWDIFATTALAITALSILAASSVEAVVLDCTHSATTANLALDFQGDGGADRYLILSAEL